MFETRRPRMFALPPGVDFPAMLVQGLRDRMAAQPPDDMARIEIYLNTSRMRRAVVDAFTASGASFLPRLRLVTDPGNDPLSGSPAAVPPLRRRLELAQLIARLLDAQPDLAPRTALFDLAESLAALMDEMRGEGVTAATVAALDVSDHSAHWQRTQAFLGIVASVFAETDAPDAEARQRLAVLRLAALWQTAPPGHPVVVAGSTGSRGTTALLMQAVAALPQGALIVPGYDFCMSAQVWADLSDAMTAEDHPQYRYRRLMDALEISPDQVRPWQNSNPKVALNQLVSLALRPAPVTDQWLVEGGRLPDLSETTAQVTLIEASGPRAEATAIALVLRKAAQDRVSAALITPDRVLARRVVAALDRWGILPDDSAGSPLGLSAPGRLLRQVVSLFGRKLTSEALLALLKHPLTGAGAARGDHLRWARDLELRLRRHGPVFPTPNSLTQWAATQRDTSVPPWVDWLVEALADLENVGRRALSAHVAHHLALTETLVRGWNGDTAERLWAREAGEAARAVMTDLEREAPHGGDLTPMEYGALFNAVLARGEVREAVQGHPLIRILGPREARECRTQRVVLAGLNDGSWPQLPPPDPWLNRQMRKNAGLLLPERQIGLSAHDFQQAIAAPEVFLTRALRDAEAESVPSRWMNRLMNLMNGLPAQHGPTALAQMRARGQVWLDMARLLDTPQSPVEPSHRPAPRPPVDHRPRELAVTGIRTLIRDPYAIYARYILRLRPLDPLHHEPDALARGSILHTILERFVRERVEESQAQARARLLAIADTVLAEDAPWPAARALWRARLDRAAGAFLAREATREGHPVIIETRGAISLPSVGFTLTAKPDRIDELPDGRLHILDYKTGAPPTQKQQKAFDKQLLLEAAMAERGAFPQLGPREVDRITYVGLNAAAKVETTVISPDLTAVVWDDLHRLIARYMTREQGYAARRAVFESRFPGDYDHLARFGEWDMTDLPQPGDVG